MGSASAQVGARRRASRARLAAALVVAVAVLLAAVASAAAAGTYEVWSCRGPNGKPVATDAWTLSKIDEAALTIEDTCASGGALRLAVSPKGRSSSSDLPAALATLNVPAGVRVRAYELRRSLRVATSLLNLGHAYMAGIREGVRGTFVNRACPSVVASEASLLGLPLLGSACAASGNPNEPNDASNVDARPNVDLDGLQLFAQCSRRACTGLSLLGGAAGAEVKLFGARITLQDAKAPRVVRVGGAAAAGEQVRGRTTLVVEATDAGSGIAKATLAIDGRAVQTLAPAGADGACKAPYTRAQPCPTEVTRAFAIDADQLAPGAHTLTGKVIDVAGNATSFGPVRLVVAPDLRNGRPVVRRPRLRLAARRVQHRRGQPAWIAGTLRTPAGAPVVGARLTVTVQQLGRRDAPERALRPVTTGRDGRFRARIAGTGARRVRVAFAPTIGGEPTVTAVAVVRERMALSIARSPARVGRGGEVVLSGRLTGAGPAAADAVVELQAIVNGRWRAVETVRTTRAGRYRWSYRFRYVTRDTIFSFRAVVRRTPGWPWPTVASRAVTVRVDGA